jgi:hypothetical protein
MSLEGLNALIQLESTRLEGAKQSSSNSNQVNSAVQQIGLQTASSKQSLLIQHINAEYEKDCAQATVKRLESKLGRERQAEKLAASIAGLVTIGSGLSNLFNAGSDLFGGAQKLGDIPKSMEAPALDPSHFQASIVATPGSSGKEIIFSPPQDGDGKFEDPESINTAVIKGDGTVDGFRACTLSNAQKAQIGGEAYAKLKEQNGGKDLSFADIQKKNPFLAEAMISDRAHPMTRGEVEGFMKCVNAANDKGTTAEIRDEKGDVMVNRPVIDGVKEIENIQNGLISIGKATEHDFKGGLGKLWDNTKDTGKALLNCMVQTANDAVPYFQAYLKAKDKADNTMEELQEAVAKLNAAAKKLKSIEMSIDMFAGKGA